MASSPVAQKRSGRLFLPWRFGLFLLLCLSTFPLLAVFPADYALMGGFDIAVMGFLLSLVSLFRHDQGRMREHARTNDANRSVMLLITSIVMMVLLVLVASELRQKSAPAGPAIAMILGTLALAWLFSNLVYALHYAFLFYGDSGSGQDKGGIDFPGVSEPDYWDFAYFSFTLGMTFQTSDVAITSAAVRRTVLSHSLAAFVYNLGILAFTINVLGSS
jgi:uncharacterized membrane protein